MMEMTDMQYEIVKKKKEVIRNDALEDYSVRIRIVEGGILRQRKI